MSAVSELEIRRVAADEHDAVDELVRRAYEHDYGARDGGDDPFRHSSYRARRSEVWVAADGGELVGTVTVGRPELGALMEDLREGELDFRLLAVAPEARGRGIGEALTRLVIERARERGFSGVFMKSGPQMLGAHRLYTRIGFRRDEERDGLIRGGVKQFELFAFVIEVAPDSALV